MNQPNWWKMSLGRQGCLWDACRADGIIVMGNYGAPGLGDLMQYSDPRSLQEVGVSPSGARQLWDFLEGIQVDDRVVAYAQGEIQGVGHVIGGYRLLDRNDEYFEGENYLREVRWQAFDPPIPIHGDPILWGNRTGGGPFTQNATLVPLDQSHVDRLKEIFRDHGIEAPWVSSSASDLTPPPQAGPKTAGQLTASESDENLSTGGQGFRVSPQVRCAVEEYAMRRATAHFEELGYAVTRVGKPFDLKCRRGEEVLYVEVKGTQTAGCQIILTRNEVEFARNPANKMALFVLSEVAVGATEVEPVASEGRIRVINPWKIEDDRLSAIAYDYVLPPESG